MIGCLDLNAVNLDPLKRSDRMDSCMGRSNRKPELTSSATALHAPMARLHPGEIDAAGSDQAAARAYLLSHGGDLLRDGIYPRLPAEGYLNNLVKVLSFIHAHQAQFTQAYLGPDVCAAAETIALELQSLPDVPLDRIPNEAQATHPFTATAALLLSAYQQSVRKTLTGASIQEKQVANYLPTSFQTKDAQQVASAIALFLEGARRFPYSWSRAGITATQLQGLASQERMLSGWVQHHQQRGNPSLAHVRQARLLHAALEYFFDRYAAIVSAKFLDLPAERLRALRWVPRKPRTSQTTHSSLAANAG